MTGNKIKISDKQKNIIIYALILIGVILFWVPYFGQGFTNGAEIKFHYARIITLADSLKQGIFPAKIRPMHMKLYGYGIGFFYPDLFIYPPAIFIALGASYDITVKIYLFIVTLVGCVVTYRCFERLTGNKYLALFGETLMLMSAVNDQNIFGGGGMPHLFAYLFIPLAFEGLFEALDDKKGGAVKYAVGMTIVLLTHNMIFLTMMFAMILVVILGIGRIIKKPVIILKLFGVSLAAMVLTCAYWLPAMEQIMHIQFIAFFDNAYTVSDHILTLQRLVFGDVGILYFGMFFACVVLYFYLLIKRKKMPLDVTSLLVICIFLMWFMCSKSFWNSNMGDTLNFFEYTDRFDYVFTILMVMFMITVMREGLAEFTKRLSSLQKYEKYLPAALLLMVIIITRAAARPDFLDISSSRAMLYRDLLFEEYQVSGAEWLPASCEPTECKTPETAKADDGSGADGFKHDDAKYFEVWVDFSHEYYDVPYVYYYGYRAYILDENDNPVRELEVSEAKDDNGYVRVYMPEDDDSIGHIMVTYRKTFIQKLSYVISAVSVFALIITIPLYKRKQGKRE